MKNKVEVQLRRANLSSNKKNHVKEPIYDANVKHTMLNVNSELFCAKCKQCCPDFSLDLDGVDLLSGSRDTNLYTNSLDDMAKAINTACYTQNCSLIRVRYNKTPYELMDDKKPDLSFLHVFGSLYYSTNDTEDMGKLNTKAGIGIFLVTRPQRKLSDAITGEPGKSWKPFM
nr:retrovirus-related Pol polyprotein from transposon TNT 1-94 [Tanacetum cinerariifolium]